MCLVAAHCKQATSSELEGQIATYKAKIAGIGKEQADLESFARKSIQDYVQSE